MGLVLIVNWKEGMNNELDNFVSYMNQLLEGLPPGREREATMNKLAAKFCEEAKTEKERLFWKSFIGYK